MKVVSESMFVPLIVGHFSDELSNELSPAPSVIGGWRGEGNEPQGGSKVQDLLKIGPQRGKGRVEACFQQADMIP